MEPFSSRSDRISKLGLLWFFGLLLAAVVVGVVAIQIWPHNFGHSTNEYHLPLLLSLRGQIGNAGDEVAWSIGRYAAPIWWAIAYLPIEIHPKTLFFVGYLVSRILFASGFGLLVAVVTGRNRRPLHFMLGCAVSLAPFWYGPLPAGGDPVLGLVFSQTAISIGVLAFALAAGLNGKNLVSAALFGLAMDINPLQSFLASAFLMVTWTGDSRAPREVLRRTVQSIVVALIVGSPSIALSMRSLLSDPVGPQLEGKALADFARYFLEGHFFLFSKTRETVISCFSLAFLPLLLGWSLGRPRRQLVAFTFAPLVAIAAQVLLVEIYPTRLLFRLHLLRSDVFSMLLAAGLAMALLLRGGRNRTADAAIGGACLLHLCCGMPLACAISAGIGLLSKYVNKGVGFTVILFAITLGLAVHAGLRGMELVPVGYLLLLAAIFPERYHPAGLTGLLRAAVFGAALTASIMSYRLNWDNDRTRFLKLNDQSMDSALKAASDTLPSDALVVVPPMINARAFLGSKVWFNFYEGAAFLWAPGSETETLRRINVLGLPYQTLERYDVSVIGPMWRQGHCARIPRLQSEGVTHILIANDTLGRDGTFGWRVVRLKSAFDQFCAEKIPSKAVVDR